MCISHRKLNIRYCQQTIKEPQFSDFQTHSDYEIFWLLSGEGRFIIENNHYHLASFDLIIVNANETHRDFFAEKTPCKYVSIHFDPNLLTPFSQLFNLHHCFLAKRDGDYNILSPTKSQREKLAPLFKRMDSLFAPSIHENQANEILKYTTLIELVFYVNQFLLEDTETPLQNGFPESLSVVLDYIDKNIGHELSLEILEKRFYINRSYLSRLFRKHLNISIHKYIILQRIAKAKELLLKGHSPLSASRYSGFNDYSNFRKMFKKVTKTSPSEYSKDKLKLIKG